MHFRRPRRSRGVGDVNITPLVDMVFNLIIFLLISTTFKTAERAFVIDLPTAGQEQVEVTEHSPVVFVKKSGDYFFLTTDDATQGEPEAVGLDVLKERLRALKAGLLGAALLALLSLPFTRNLPHEAGTPESQGADAPAAA